MPDGIKAVIFDYGNVLCEPQPREDVAAMAAELGQDYDRFLPVYWRDRGPYDRAELDAREYWDRVAGRTLAPEQVAKLVQLDNKSWTHPRRPVISWVSAAASQGLGTALLSNLPAGLRVALENDCPWMPEFNARTYSCDLRKTKPDPAIYQHSIEGLGRQPGEILFLDDRPENIEGAAALGIRALLFTTPGEAAREISERFGLSFTAGAADGV